MRVTTLIIIIAIIAAGLWYANETGYFKKAEEAADSFEAHYSKGIKLYQQEQYEEAIKEFDAAVAANPTHEQAPNAERRRADCTRELGKTDPEKIKEAIALYEAWIEKYPDHKMAANTRTILEKTRELGTF